MKKIVFLLIMLSVSFLVSCSNSEEADQIIGNGVIIYSDPIQESSLTVKMYDFDDLTSVTVYADQIVIAEVVEFIGSYRHMNGDLYGYDETPVSQFKLKIEYVIKGEIVSEFVNMYYYGGYINESGDYNFNDEITYFEKGTLWINGIEEDNDWPVVGDTYLYYLTDVREVLYEQDSKFNDFGYFLIGGGNFSTKLDSYDEKADIVDQMQDIKDLIREREKFVEESKDITKEDIKLLK